MCIPNDFPKEILNGGLNASPTFLNYVIFLFFRFQYRRLVDIHLRYWSWHLFHNAAFLLNMYILVQFLIFFSFFIRKKKKIEEEEVDIMSLDY